MKKKLLIFYLFAHVLFLLAAQNEQATIDDTVKEVIETDSEVAEQRLAVVPPKKRPRASDNDKSSEAAKKDTGPDYVKKSKETIKYGIESDIIELLDTFTKNDDPRFMDDVYDLFQITKNETIRRKVLAYFSKMKDPCLEDYAVSVLNDPYDENDALVSDALKYISAVKCVAALPAVMNLLDADNEKYFDATLSALSEIGGETEADIVAGYLDREDLSIVQRQAVVKALGKMKAANTIQVLTQIANDTTESAFLRAYAAKSLGDIGGEESFEVLEKLFEDSDPTVRQYVIMGIKNYESNRIKDIIIQGIRDGHYKVRLEAIKAAGELKIQDSVPYLVHRAKNDPEGAVKKACYSSIAGINTPEGNDYLLSVLQDKKTSDNTKANVADSMFSTGNVNEKAILVLAMECLSDDRRKPLRYALGKLFSKYVQPQYAGICGVYLDSKDTSTVGTGLDMYAAGKYSGQTEKVRAIAENNKAGANQKKAKHILGIED